jgi:5-oxoprolinase (ATP-hydrolysing)
MPPLSKLLAEEGAVFNSHLLVRGGYFDEDELYRMLCVEPAQFPGSSGSRCFQDNVTDLKAQVAANHCGIRLMRQLIEEYSMDVVQVRNIPPMHKEDRLLIVTDIHARNSRFS